MTGGANARNREGVQMIRDYANNAANERTFLAWIRTSIAVIALGFVIERFNLFLLALAAGAGDRTELPAFHRLPSQTSRWGGVALVACGVAMIVVATIRFRQTARLLEDQENHRPRATESSLFALYVLVLGVAAFSAYLAIG
jgi:putative membrane protein